ncbi:hypothetical protein HKD37_14G040196 [Glycine soja]
MTFVPRHYTDHHHRPMATPPASPSPPHPSHSPPPPAIASASFSTLKRTRKATRLRSLATKPPGAERPVVHVNPATGKADGPHKKKLRTYLGIVAHDKIDMTYDTWKEVPAAQKDLIWEDIQAKIDIPKASEGRTKKKVLQTVDERWRRFKSDLTRKWTLAVDKDSVDDTVCEKYGISKEKWAQIVRPVETPRGRMCEKRHESSRSKTPPPTCCLVRKMMDEKTKKKLKEVAQSGSTEGVIDPPSPIRRHVKWKMARTKKTGASVTGFVCPPWTSRCPECCHWATRTPWPCACCWSWCDHKAILWIGSTNLLQFFLDGSQRTRAVDSTNQGLAGGVNHRKSDSAADVIIQPDAVPGLALPSEPEVGPTAARVSTKESCIDPSGNDPETGDSDKCGLYIEENLSRLVGVEEVKDAEAPVPVPTNEVNLVGPTLNTLLAWPIHLVKRLSKQAVVSPAKLADGPDPPVHDPLYLMTLTIPQLFLKPLQVMWDAIVFRVFNEHFPLYIKHEDLSEIAHGGQCLSISRSGQSQFESESYMKSWMQSSKRDFYLGTYLNGPDNYLKGIINSALKGLDDTSQPKSKVVARWIVVKCGYYVMYWMSTIILGSFRNNWETYFNDVKPLEAEKLKTLRIQWAQYYLKVKNQT